MKRTKWMTVFGSVVLIATLAGARKADPAEVMLETAARKERVDGDLKAAVERYRKVASQFAKRPEVAAQALLRMGQCQEKLGQAEARKSYERIVREYAGAGPYAAQARARLMAMGGDGAGARREMRARLLWDEAADGGYGWGVRGTTADGRQVALKVGESDLAIRDLLTGEQRRVTNRGEQTKPAVYPEHTLISPDGSRIAFLWGQDIPSSNDPSLHAGQHYSVRVVRADGTDERVVLDAGKSTAVSDPVYYWVDSWSPDGKWIAVQENPNPTSAVRHRNQEL